MEKPAPDQRRGKYYCLEETKGAPFYDDEVECSICHEDLTPDEPTLTHAKNLQSNENTPCRKSWHKSCVEAWNKTSRSRRFNCPFCRANLDLKLSLKVPRDPALPLPARARTLNYSVPRLYDIHYVALRTTEMPVVSTTVPPHPELIPYTHSPASTYHVVDSIGGVIDRIWPKCSEKAKINMAEYLRLSFMVLQKRYGGLQTQRLYNTTDIVKQPKLYPLKPDDNKVMDFYSSLGIDSWQMVQFPGLEEHAFILPISHNGPIIRAQYREALISKLAQQGISSYCHHVSPLSSQMIEHIIEGMTMHQHLGYTYPTMIFRAAEQRLRCDEWAIVVAELRLDTTVIVTPWTRDSIHGVPPGDCMEPCDFMFARETLWLVRHYTIFEQKFQQDLEDCRSKTSVPISQKGLPLAEIKIEEDRLRPRRFALIG